MPERPGPWELLDKPSDPVVADLPEMNSRLAYFRSLAETMRTEGQRLSQISSGESLKGQYADKLRSSSGTVAKDLDQVVGRYEAVVQALTTYQPALETALLGSSQALDDAIDANAAVQAADAMPTATAPPGQKLTAQQEQANTDKTTATGAAADRLNAAKQRLAGVLSALDQAGQAAAATIRKGFNDGLTDSLWDRIKAFFKKFLQILIKILTYVAMALAVIALVIPGVGEALLAATVAIAAVTLVAEVGLKALGGGSWADIGMAIAGLLTFGAAKVLGPAISAGVKSITSAVRGADAAEDGTVVGADAAVGAGNAAKSDAEINSEVDKTLDSVNPNFKKGESAYSENCTGVVQANELTRRGIPAEAGPLEKPLRTDAGGNGGRKPSTIENAWGRKFTAGSKADIEQAFKDPGSRGIVSIRWNKGGGHVFNVENVGGTVRFLDGQPIPVRTDASFYFTHGSKTKYLRLDDLPTPSPSATSPYVTTPAAPVTPATPATP